MANNYVSMNEIVAVTGGTGFIGQYLVNSLLAEGCLVRILTRSPDTAKIYWGDQVEIWHGDLTVPDSLAGFIDNASTVYNLAGVLFDSELFKLINELGTINLLKECVSQPIKRFVHLSSVGVTGSVQQKIIDENVECNPSNNYEQSKLQGELAVMNFCRDYGVPVTVLRPTIVFGKGRSRKKDSFASWMQAVQSGRFRYIGHDEYVANYIYVEDVATACIHVTKHIKAIGEIFIVSDSCPLEEFVETAVNLLDAPSPPSIPLWIAQIVASASGILEKITNSSLPLTQSRMQALTSTTSYSSQKLREMLGFEPIVGYREGIIRTIRWYQEQDILAN